MAVAPSSARGSGDPTLSLHRSSTSLPELVEGKGPLLRGSLWSGKWALGLFRAYFVEPKGTFAAFHVMFKN